MRFLVLRGLTVSSPAQSLQLLKAPLSLAIRDVIHKNVYTLLNEIYFFWRHLQAFKMFMATNNYNLLFMYWSPHEFQHFALPPFFCLGMSSVCNRHYMLMLFKLLTEELNVRGHFLFSISQLPRKTGSPTRPQIRNYKMYKWYTGFLPHMIFREECVVRMSGDTCRWFDKEIKYKIRNLILLRLCAHHLVFFY